MLCVFKRLQRGPPSPSVKCVRAASRRADAAGATAVPAAPAVQTDALQLHHDLRARLRTRNSSFEGMERHESEAGCLVLVANVWCLCTPTSTASASASLGLVPFSSGVGGKRNAKSESESAPAPPNQTKPRN